MNEILKSEIPMEGSMSKHFLLLIGARRKADSRNWGTKIRFTAMILFLVISLIGINHGVASAASTTYYVDNTVTCSDSGLGTMATPFCTLARAAFKTVAGDTVRVLHGTYAETVSPPTGTVGQPVIFQADPGVTVTGNSAGFGSAFSISSKSYIVIDGFNITQTKYFGIYATASNHITITNNHISYAGDPGVTDSHTRGIYLSSTTDSTITGNTTDHNTCVGIMLINGSDHNIISNNNSFANSSTIVADAAGISLIGSSYNTVTNNNLYGNEDSGISIYDYNSILPASYNLIAGNLVYGNGDHGIDNNDAPYNTIVGNTIHGNGTVGLNFEGSWIGSHDAIIANNIIVANGITPNTGAFGGNLRVDPLSVAGTTLDYDLFDSQGAGVQIIWNSNHYASLSAFHVAEPGKEAHGIESDPLFVTPVAPVLRTNDRPYYITARIGDYHLSTGSPAIDSANSDAPSQPVVDIEGHARIDAPATVDSGVGTRTYDDRGTYEFQPSGATSATTTVDCGTPIVTYRSSLSCVVTVARGSGSDTPTGKINWATGESGLFTNGQCTLLGSGGTATCSVSYVPRAVGSGSHLITANYAGDVNFHPSSGSQSVTVNTKALTPAITASSKTYDGTPAATILTHTLTGALGGDIVLLTGGTASFNDKNVGNGKLVTVGGFSLTGLNASNYHLSPAIVTTTADITKAQLTVTADHQTKRANQPDPAFMFNYSGFLGSDTSVEVDTPPTCNVSGSHSIAGLYSIICSGGVDNNYSFTYVNGTLSVGLKYGSDTTGVFRPSNGLLYLKNQNTTGFADVAINYGIGGDQPISGDWDGNGTATIGVYRSGKFYLRNSNTLGFADMVFAFGQIGDQPVAGDWDGDGIDTIGVYRPSNGLFLLRNSNSAGSADMSFYLGNVGDVGIAGDWDGDGKDTTGVFRPSNGVIFLKNTNETGFADITLNYGLAGDKPVTGDWDNDGKDTIGVYRGNVFYLRNSNTVGFADMVFALGIPGDMPIAGNWDGQP
jgi:parallel beta-helix repeat protein